MGLPLAFMSIGNTIEKDFINQVVDEFYGLATTDILIGHQFRKIALKEITDGHPLRPPLEAFIHHLPRIKTFWYIHLLGESRDADTPPFDLIAVHRELSIRMGELNRWILLFHNVLNEQSSRYDCDPRIKELVKQWREKILLFENKFKKVLF